jgi:DNA repair exonuclease SbcCD ATPase subunit
MKIQNLLIEGFGKISKMELNLGAGLNVIYGKNEAGKTTLKTFIYGMLYGFLKPGDYKVRKFEDAYEKYRPWQDDQKYGGELVYTLSSKQRFRVKRDFNLDTVTIIDENTWQDLTEDFPVYLKECQFAQGHLGIEKEIFRDCVYIKQQNIDTIENPGALASRLQSIATTSTEELSLQTALDKLDSASDRVGTEQRRKTSPLGRCSAKTEQLKNEHADVRKKHDQLTLSINELDALKQQRSGPLNEQQQFQYLIACVEAKEIETRLENIRDYNVNIDQIEQELEILQAYQNFPVDRRDELLISQTQLSENKRRKEKLEVELCDNEKDQLELLEQLQSLSGCEQIGERLEEIRRLESRHKLLIEEEIKDSAALADIQEDFTMQSNWLNDDESRFNSMDNDQFTQILQDESNLQQNQENLDLRQREINRESERLDNLNHRRQSQKKQSKFLIFSGVVAWIAAAVLLTLSVALSVVIFSVGLLGGFFSIQKRKQVKTLESQIDELSADIENKKVEFERDQQELADAKKVMEDLFEQVAVSSSDELKAEYAKLQEQRQDVKRLKERVEELNDKLQRTQEDRQDTERQLYNLISPALDSKEGGIDDWLALFRAN